MSQQEPIPDSNVPLKLELELAPELLAQLKAIADHQGQTVEQLIEQVLVSYLENRPCSAWITISNHLIPLHDQSND